MLQDAIKQPDHSEGELQLAARIERREADPRLTSTGPRRGAADREALAHLRTLQELI
jgi:hypothetical protein